MFQPHIWRNKIQKNAVEMHLYERFKIDVPGMSQGRHPSDIFWECFEDVWRTFLQNFNNRRRITLKYFTQHIGE